MHLMEKTIESKVVFEGKIITVKNDKAELEDGTIVSRELVCHSGGVCVVPITNDDEIIMVKQFRYPFGEPLIEIPAGKLELNENHRSAGMRELCEETGASCAEEDFIYLGVTYPSVAYLSEKIHMYLASNLKFDKQKLDEDEFLDVIKIKIDDAIKMVENGEIKDGKTMTAILLTARRLGK